MQCIAHPTRAASNTCDKCNHHICDDCTVNAKGRLLCKTCAAQMETETWQMHSSAGEAMGEAVARAVTAPYLPHKNVNVALLLFFSVFFPPGANYMYMGLIKRGLAAMCGFFLLVYLMVAVSGLTLTMLFLLSIPILWMACFFDGFHIRRRINSGEHVDDGVGDILNGLLRNKPLALAFLIVIALVFAGTLFGIAVEIIRRAVPILLLLLAVYVIFKRKP